MGKSEVLAAVVVIAVSNEEHDAGIYFVRKQQLSKETLVIGVNFVSIIAGIIIIIHILNDCPEKGAYVELVDS